MKAAEEFLAHKQLFQLGDLPTESPHPHTTSLSQWANADLPAALQVLREVDLAALQVVEERWMDTQPLFAAVQRTLERGGRIFLVGCGATGRLSLSLEALWRREHPAGDPWHDRVRSLMAGGDVALVHSLEGFEDFPPYGARHLKQLGFSAGDLVIGTTEGGETPYVIGAVEAAAEVGGEAPFFIYCNPRHLLLEKVERSRRILTDARIQSICLAVGPMALTGSTRMQASTVLMLAAGLALMGGEWAAAHREFNLWRRFLREADHDALKGFILREAEAYQAGNFTCYETGDYAITVFTDTTERAPTFNIAPFENARSTGERFSLTYVALPSAADAGEAWRQLLGRDPRPLTWPEVHPKTTDEYLMSFDFSRNAGPLRARLRPDAQHFPFSIVGGEQGLVLRFRDVEERFRLSGQNQLFDHLTLKMLLNRLSTLVMGRLGRFEGNLMTWVYPSNGKLVDRAVRYTQILLRQRGQDRFSYDEIVRAQFAAKETLDPSQSIVHQTLARLLG